MNIDSNKVLGWIFGTWIAGLGILFLIWLTKTLINSIFG